MPIREIIAEEAGVQLIAKESTHELGQVMIRTGTFEVRATRSASGTHGGCIIPAGSELNHAMALFAEVVKAANYQPTLQQQEI